MDKELYLKSISSFINMKDVLNIIQSMNRLELFTKNGDRIIIEDRDDINEILKNKKSVILG